MLIAALWWPQSERRAGGLRHDSHQRLPLCRRHLGGRCAAAPYNFVPAEVKLIAFQFAQLWCCKVIPPLEAFHKDALSNCDAAFMKCDLEILLYTKKLAQVRGAALQ